MGEDSVGIYVAVRRLRVWPNSIVALVVVLVVRIAAEGVAWLAVIRDTVSVVIPVIRIVVTWSTVPPTPALIFVIIAVPAFPINYGVSPSERDIPFTIRVVEEFSALRISNTGAILANFALPTSLVQRRVGRGRATAI